MIERSIKNYFTTGELSKLCKIPRKTLLYYDKLGLITPEMVDDNGYRYYKRSQVFLLELIITLRHLDVPLKNIQEYLDNKSTDNYKKMLQQKKAELKKKIEELSALKGYLDEYLPTLEDFEDFSIGEIIIQQQPDQYIYLSKPIVENMDFKARSAVSAALFTDLRKKQPVNRHSFGYMMDNTVLQATGNSADFIRYYFYPMSDNAPGFACSLKPAGTYLTIYCKGVYMTHSKGYLQKLAEYCTAHSFTPVSYVYVTYLKNYWLTDNTSEYVYKIELRIN